MTAKETRIDGVKLLTPRIFRDERGAFLESCNEQVLSDILGRPIHFVQENCSRSRRGVLRGLHLQVEPMAQAKLLRVVRGKIHDVVVDLRPGSPTFQQWLGVDLTDQDCEQIWIPEGFAHGFLALSEDVEVLYKVTAPYSPDHERTLRWDDPDLLIPWPVLDIPPILSPRDAAAQSLAEFLSA